MAKKFNGYDVSGFELNQGKMGTVDVWRVTLFVSGGPHSEFTWTMGPRSEVAKFLSPEKARRAIRRDFGDVAETMRAA